MESVEILQCYQQSTVGGDCWVSFKDAAKIKMYNNVQNNDEELLCTPN